jgi:hypothetical protein
LVVKVAGEQIEPTASELSRLIEIANCVGMRDQSRLLEIAELRYPDMWDDIVIRLSEYAKAFGCVSGDFRRGLLVVEFSDALLAHVRLWTADGVLSDMEVKIAISRGAADTRFVIEDVLVP